MNGRGAWVAGVGLLPWLEQGGELGGVCSHHVCEALNEGVIVHAPGLLVVLGLEHASGFAQ